MQNITAFKELISSPKKIVITTHHKPDADALGSSLGLAGFLKKKHHQVSVISPSDYPRFLHWMQGNEEVIVYNEGNESRSAALIRDADIVFCLDFSALARINDMGALVKNTRAMKVLIDHHLEPEQFADFSFWDASAAATSQLVYDLIVELKEYQLIDVHIAQCLYAGIMTDTGSFRHPCTTKRVHQVVGELIDLGVDTSAVHRLVYDNNTEDRLRFLGFALSERLQVIREYNVAYFYVTASDLKRFNTQTGDTEGLVNYALSIENIVMAAIIIDRTEAIKLSFRSVGSFSVSDFSRKHFEGGGHKNAAGGISHVSLEQTIEKFKSLLPLYKEELNHINKSINQHV